MGHGMELGKGYSKIDILHLLEKIKQEPYFCLKHDLMSVFLNINCNKIIDSVHQTGVQ